jgi:hypothetical protein
MEGSEESGVGKMTKKREGDFLLDENTYVTGTGQIINNVHDEEDCKNGYCPIHNPSDHPMKKFPTNWRHDRGIMERMCPHGVGHPDPDDIRIQLGRDKGIHGCDGCCAGSYTAVQEATMERIKSRAVFMTRKEYEALPGPESVLTEEGQRKRVKDNDELDYDDPDLLIPIMECESVLQVDGEHDHITMRMTLVIIKEDSDG